MAKNKRISARISDAQPKNSSGNYARLFGDDEIGRLISQVQSASIKAGYVLEDIIAQVSILIPGGNLDEFIDDSVKGKYSGIFLATKKMIKASKKYHVEGHEPDMIIFSLQDSWRRECYIIELKVGAAFDTKKSDAEKETLEICRSVLGPKLPFITNFYLCAFHAENRKEITEGLKGRFSKEEVLTGRELCEILQLDYDEIVNEERQFQNDNLNYFMDTVLENARRKNLLNF